MRAAALALLGVCACAAEEAAPDAAIPPGTDAAPDAAPPDAEERPGAPLFVAVGYAGRRVVSPDGVTWLHDVEEPGPGGDDDQNLRGACHGDGMFMAVGGSARGRVMTTGDGERWTEYWDDHNWIGGCAHGDGVFVAVGGQRSLRSLDRGATWIDLQARYGWGMRDVAYGDGRFVAVGDQGARAVSTDGATWTVLPAVGAGLRRIAWGNGRFVATGSDRIASSIDGETWDVEVAAPMVGAVAFGDGRFVITGEFDVWTSTDGVSFLAHPSQALGSLAWGNGAWVATHWPNERRRSLDALSWTATASDDGAALGDVVFGITGPNP